MTTNEIENLLSFIPCDQLSRAEWLKIGMAIKEGGADCSIWDRWSASDFDRYHNGECAKFWDKFTTGGGVTVATLVYMAKQYGYKKTVAPSQALDWDSPLEYYDSFDNAVSSEDPDDFGPTLLDWDTIEKNLQEQHQRELDIMQLFNGWLHDDVEDNLEENNITAELHELVYLIENVTDKRFDKDTFDLISCAIRYASKYTEKHIYKACNRL